MKNKIWLTMNLVLLLAIIGSQSVHAQNMANGSFAVSPGFALANCPSTAIAGMTTFCPTGAGQVYYCLAATTTCATSTAGWVAIGGTIPNLNVTLNGITKTLPATFTLTSAQANPSITAQ